MAARDDSADGSGWRSGLLGRLAGRGMREAER